MTQTEARQRAQELRGIAVSARPSSNGKDWHLGGWPQPGDEWIVISPDRKEVWDDAVSVN